MKVLALAVAAALLIGPSAVRAQPAPDDAQLYAKAVATMRGLPEPAYLTFVTRLTAKGLDEIVLHDVAGVGELRVFGHGGRVERSAFWQTSYRERDTVASIADPARGHLVTHSAVYIPAWSGVYEWLRFGIDGRPFPASPAAEPSPAPSDQSLRTIGFVRAVAPSAYRIVEADAAACPDGAPGRHLRLEARDGDTRTHPLNDVTIDEGSARFCSMRLILPIRGGRGVSELHFGTVGAYLDDDQQRRGDPRDGTRAVPCRAARPVRRRARPRRARRRAVHARRPLTNRPMRARATEAPPARRSAGSG